MSMTREWQTLLFISQNSLGYVCVCVCVRGGGGGWGMQVAEEGVGEGGWVGFSVKHMLGKGVSRFFRQT